METTSSAPFTPVRATESTDQTDLRKTYEAAMAHLHEIALHHDLTEECQEEYRQAINEARHAFVELLHGGA